MTSRRLTLTDPLALAAKPAEKEYQIHDHTLQGLMLRVQPSGAKSWVYRRRVDGKPKRITFGSAETMPIAEARAKIHALLAADARHVMPSKPKGRSFAAIVDVYLERRTPHWKPSTRATNECYLRTTLLHFFADMPIDGITRADVSRWFHEYGRTRPGGANRALAILGDLFQRARDWGMLGENAPNPAKGIKKNRPARNGQLLNDAQLQRLGEVLDRYALVHSDATDAIRLILLTGCRSGEILKLSWQEVKADRLKLDDSKTGPREVLLGKPAILLLQRRRQHRHGAYVFPSPFDADKPRRTIICAWRRICRDAGLDGLRLHDLRHTFASHAVMQGEGLFMAGKLLGHRYASSTERYAHLEGKFLLDAAERIGEEIIRRSQLA
jgi:integrase